MKKLYPLKFRPSWKPKAWGGESWDLCGFEDDASVVSEGFLAENDIADILETYLGDLVGDEIFDYYGLNFPLLYKRLQIDDRLSVQVHPDDELAAQLFESFGKTEFWYVTEAGRDARIWMGFREDTDASTLYAACKAGTADRLLRAFVPRPGDCFFIPAGTVHAAGGGVKITEIQQSSDITFRLYDWGRELNPATRREMHLEEALDSIDYRRYDEAACHVHLDPAGGGSVGGIIQGLADGSTRGSADGNVGERISVVARCPHFIITSLQLNDPARPARVRMEEFKSCVTYNCVAGSATVIVGGASAADSAGRTNPAQASGGDVSTHLAQASGGDGRYTLAAGEMLLVPASLDEILLVPGPGGCHLLQTHIPQPPKDNVYDGPEPE